MNQDELRKQILNLAPVQYQEWYEQADSGDLENAINELNGLVQRAARLGEYLEHRKFGGGHDGAVTASNRLVSRVRKAMGYTYYKQDLHF